MGGVASKEAITARLDELDKKELELNIKLKELQMQLNELVPDEEKIKVNENLGVDPENIQEMQQQTPAQNKNAEGDKEEEGDEDDEDKNEDEEEEDEEDEEGEEGEEIGRAHV